MTPAGLYGFLILAAFVAANIPWLSDRLLVVFKRDKSAWMRWQAACLSLSSIN